MKKDSTNVVLCTLNCLRRTTRVTSQVFDSEMAELGIRSTQFSLMATIEGLGESPITQLASSLLMDRTTLTRNLKPLEGKGYLVIKTFEDKRVKYVSLTKEGKGVLEKAKPIWEKVQLDIVSEIGKDKWEDLIDSLNLVLKVVT